MADFIGEIRLFAGNFTIQNWLKCDGALVPISTYEALFALIGTTYGGNGTTTFALPDLRGRVPVHMGQGPGLSPRTIGEFAGRESVTLTTSNIPQHNHGLMVSSQLATSNAPDSAAVFAQTSSPVLYSATAAPAANMSPATITPAGGGQPFDNMMPYLPLNFLICAFGIFPPQS